MRFFNQRKGQSAIEYLMTYGWMLLVVAIVGGAIFATVQSSQQGCEGEIPMALDSQQQGFGLTTVGVTDSNGLEMAFENAGQQEVTLANITVDVGGDTSFVAPDETLGLGETHTASLADFTSSEDCATMTVNVEYSQNDVTDQLSGEIEEGIAYSP